MLGLGATMDLNRETLEESIQCLKATYEKKKVQVYRRHNWMRQDALSKNRFNNDPTARFREPWRVSNLPRPLAPEPEMMTLNQRLCEIEESEFTEVDHLTQRLNHSIRMLQ